MLRSIAQAHAGAGATMCDHAAESCAAMIGSPSVRFERMRNLFTCTAAGRMASLLPNMPGCAAAGQLRDTVRAGTALRATCIVEVIEAIFPLRGDVSR